MNATKIQDFSKTVRMGSQPRVGSTYAKIEYREGKLSICGVEGPMSNGNAKGSCGQICMGLKPSDFTSFAEGWNVGKVAQFLTIWNTWHLNDMQAGAPDQTAAINAWVAEGNRYEYTAACEYLKSIDLYVVAHPVTGKPYTYGHEWLTVEVPADVLEWLQALPDTDQTPAWV